MRLFVLVLALAACHSDDATSSSVIAVGPPEGIFDLSGAASCQTYTTMHVVPVPVDTDAGELTDCLAACASVEPTFGDVACIDDVDAMPTNGTCSYADSDGGTKTTVTCNWLAP